MTSSSIFGLHLIHHLTVVKDGNIYLGALIMIHTQGESGQDVCMQQSDKTCLGDYDWKSYGHHMIVVTGRPQEFVLWP